MSSAGWSLGYFALARHAFSSEWLWLPIAAYFILALIHQRVIRARTRAETAVAMYRRGIARIEDRWAGTGQTGERFRDPAHVYADDLDLFGRGCLFELLSTARLPMGENQLARWLKSPSTRAEILERQQLVAELRDKLDLQRDLAVMGEELRARLNPESLVAWAEGKREMPGAIWHFAAIFLALAFIATFAWSIAEPQLLASLVRARLGNYFPPRALPSRTPRQRRRFLQRRRLGAFRRCLAEIGARALRIATSPIIDGASSIATAQPRAARFDSSRKSNTGSTRITA